MGAIASQITSLTIVYSTVYSDADQRKHESSASLAFVRGIHRGPVNSPHKWPVKRKMFPFDDVIMSRGLSNVFPSNDLGFSADIVRSWTTLFYVISISRRLNALTKIQQYFIQLTNEKKVFIGMDITRMRLNLYYTYAFKLHVCMNITRMRLNLAQ